MICSPVAMSRVAIETKCRRSVNENTAFPSQLWFMKDALAYRQVINASSTPYCCGFLAWIQGGIVNELLSQMRMMAFSWHGSRPQKQRPVRGVKHRWARYESSAQDASIESLSFMLCTSGTSAKNIAPRGMFFVANIPRRMPGAGLISTAQLSPQISLELSEFMMALRAFFSSVLRRFKRSFLALF